MKHLWKKGLAALTAVLLLAGLLSGCSTSAGTNAATYWKEMKRILFSGSNTPKAPTGTGDTSQGGTEIAAPGSFTVEGGTYSFAGVDNAAQYILHLCEPGSANDDDNYLYSGVVPSSGAASYTGDLRDAVDHAYGEYTVKVFAVAEDYTMSAAATAPYSCSGPLPASELAWSWDGHGELTLQIANSTDFTYSAMPDSVSVTLAGPEGTQNAQFDASLSDITVENLAAGEYTVQAEAVSTSAYVTTSSAKAEPLIISLGEEEAASDNYVKPQSGPGGPGGPGGGGWDVKPKSISFEEGAASFAFEIGEHQFLHTTANLMDTPEDGSTYTYDLANGDPGAPFEITMRLQLRTDGAAEVTTTAGGPLDASHVYGTWTVEDGIIHVEW